jgi:hypothetical protein
MWGPVHLTIHGDWATWVLAGATIALATATTVLAWAARRALDQLREVKEDRHVQVFSDMGNRWASREMTEAFHLEVKYTPDSLTRLFDRAAADRSRRPIREHRRRQAERETVILLRIPNYFEEAGTIARIGNLEPELVNDYFAGVANTKWRLWGPTLKSFQKFDEEAWVMFERMAKQGEVSVHP